MLQTYLFVFFKDKSYKIIDLIFKIGMNTKIIEDDDEFTIVIPTEFVNKSVSFKLLYLSFIV